MRHHCARIQGSRATLSSAKDENMEGRRLDSVYLSLLGSPTCRSSALLQAVFCVSLARRCAITVQGFKVPELLCRPQRTKIWKVDDLIASTFHFLDHQSPGLLPNCRPSFAFRSPGNAPSLCKDSRFQSYSVVRKGRKYGR